MLKNIVSSALIICSSFTQVSSANEDDSSYEVKYNVKINKIDHKNNDIIDGISEEKLIKQSGANVSNIFALKERIENYVDVAKRKYREAGFYDVKIDYSVSEKKDIMLIILNISSGKKYKISNLKIDVLDAHDDSHKQEIIKTISDRKFFKLRIGESASAFNVMKISQWIMRSAHKRGYPFAEVKKNILKLNGNAALVDAEFQINLGEKISFGDTKILGAENVNRDFIINRICWKSGFLYDSRTIERTSHALSNTQIFSNIAIDLDKENIKNGVAPIIVELSEDKPRAIEFSLSYSTQKRNNFESGNQNGLKSINGSISWTHFNLLSGGEKLRLKMSGAPFSMKDLGKSKNYELLSDLVLPDFITACDSMTFGIKYDRLYKSAYYKNGREAGVLWDSPSIFPDFKIQCGVNLEDNAVTGCENCERYSAICFPIIFDFDRRNSILNPTKNGRLALKINQQFLSHKNMLTLAQISGSYYYGFGNKKPTVLAGWFRLSKNFGKSISNTPLDKRLYSGGISSIRGYGAQMAGPMYQDTKHPIGGSSAIEVGCEIRKNVYKEIGAAVFVETANIKRNDNFQSGTWYTGYGIGMLYDTIVGPIRINMAFPLKRRKNIDSKVQFYISLGQAF